MLIWILCRLELGSLEFFLSSLHKAVPPHGNTVLLHNAVVNIHSLALKIHHPMSADENAGLFVSNIGFNIGQAYLYKLMIVFSSVLAFYFDVVKIWFTCGQRKSGVRIVGWANMQCIL